MKVLIIGGRGTIGRKVVHHLQQKHEILIAGRREDPYSVDLSHSESIQNLFEKSGKLDAVICIAGEAKWAPFDELQEDDYYIGIRSKLMGQVNVVRIGQHYLQNGGSITLSTGILADDPVPMTSSSAMVNGAIHSFVQAAALELNPRFRLNVVSSGLVEDSAEKYAEFFPGHTPIPMRMVINAYVRCLEGQDRGKIIRIYS